MTTAVSGTEGYGEQAHVLAEQYESIGFDDIYGDMLHLLPVAPAAAADIGAGSGRDAAALTRLGYAVVAVEPTSALREAGQQRHAQIGLSWLDDSLPALPRLSAQPGRYDLLLLTAVWMHLDLQERDLGMATLASLLSPQGRVFMTLRHGPVPAGRRMFAVSAQETFALAAAHGLRPLHSAQKPDMLGRANVHWSLIAFGRAA